MATTMPLDDTEASGTIWKRHPEFWFSDGSIVLVAHDTAFRVHKTFLARKSEVFRDMFALALPGTPIDRDSLDVDGKPALVQGQQLDGCPVVCLHGDSPFDAENFLRAIYDGPYVLFSITSCISTYTYDHACTVNSAIMERKISALSLAFYGLPLNMLWILCVAKHLYT